MKYLILQIKLLIIILKSNLVITRSGASVLGELIN
jgi:UDP-N-acetylglucosamine:LPS N-acetylglucosamine transferase